jgi:hypothetical protein
MLEITNKQKFPVQLVIRSRTAPRSFTVLNVPGIGCRKNIYLLEDERTTEYIDRAVDQGLISVKYLPNKILLKGDK